MTGLYTGPLTDSLAEQQLGTQARASTTGEMVGAVADQWAETLPEAQLGNLYDDWRSNQTQPLRPVQDLKQDYPGIDWSAPTSDDAAKRIFQRHQTMQETQSVIDRSQSSLGNTVAHYGTSLGLGLVDPLSIASFMLPAAKVGIVAEQLGKIGAESVVQRLAQRAATGAIDGIAGQAALEPISVAHAVHDYDDWSMGGSLENLAFGAAGGALLHGAFGRLHPDDANVVLRGGLAESLQGREPSMDTLGPLMDHLQATRTADALDRWSQMQDRISDPTVAPADRLAQLRASADELHSNLTNEPLTSRLDPDTAARLQDVDHRLQQLLPAEERRSLEQEREGIVGPRSDTPASEPEAASPPSNSIAQTAADAQSEIVQARMEQEVQRHAQATNTELAPGEAAAVARDISAAKPDERAAVIADRLNGLGTRSSDADVRQAAQEAQQRVQGASQRLRAEADGAAQKLVDRQRNPPLPADVAQAQRSAALRTERAPKAEGNLDQQIAELTSLKTAKDNAAKAAIDAKAVPSEHVAEYEAAQERAKRIVQDGKASEAYASNPACWGAA